MKCAVCFCYFSAVRYNKPLNNFIKFKNKLIKDKTPHFDIELLYPDQKKLISDSFLTVYSDSYMFHKENLFNILERNIDQEYNIIFLDSDIEFSDPDWFKKTADLLEEHDLVQPMEDCFWPEGHTSLNLRKSCSFALSHNLKLDWLKHFCGFGFGISRSYFKKINGLFETAVVGGGDAVFWQGVAHDISTDLCYDDPYMSKEIWEPDKYYYPLASEYLNQKKPKAKISYLKSCLATHMPHGRIRNRQYKNRLSRYLSEPITESSIYKNKHEVYEWTKKDQNDKMLRYFKDRQEDEE